jgi:hypothetical protein
MKIVLLMSAVMGQAILVLPCEANAAADRFTIGDARSLPPDKLAIALLGEQLGSRVTDVKRYDYSTSDESIPQYVEFYSKPEPTDPRLNGICRTDVITIEYNWSDLDQSSMEAAAKALPPSTALKIAHMEAIPRYKSFPLPPGEPGTPENEKAQAAECAKMTTVTDAFRAPSAGDAQWLAAIEKSYLDVSSKITFTCDDFADRSCVKAREALQRLPLRLSSKVETQDCPKIKTDDQVNYCYRLIFPYPDNSSSGFGGSPYADIVDNPTIYDQEWVLTVWAGMRTGSSPVMIRSLRLEHVPKSIPIS